MYEPVLLKGPAFLLEGWNNGTVERRNSGTENSLVPCPLSLYIHPLPGLKTTALLCLPSISTFMGC